MLAFFFGGAPSTPELLLVLIAILLLFGAKRLPEIARSVGKSMEEFRRAARDVTDEIMHSDAKPTRPAAPKPLPPRQETASVSAEGREPDLDVDDVAVADAQGPGEEERVNDGTA